MHRSVSTWAFAVLAGCFAVSLVSSSAFGVASADDPRSVASCDSGKDHLLAEDKVLRVLESRSVLSRRSLDASRRRPSPADCPHPPSKMIWSAVVIPPVALGDPSWVAVLERRQLGQDTIATYSVARNLRSGATARCPIETRSGTAAGPTVKALKVDGRGTIAWARRSIASSVVCRRLPLVRTAARPCWTAQRALGSPRCHCTDRSLRGRTTSRRSQRI